MEKVSNVVVMMIVLLMVFGSKNVEGGRKLKSKEKEVAEPDNFTGTYGGTLPGPITGTFQGPGFSGTFPSPAFAGTFPSPAFTGTFPTPTGLGFGSSFCTFPGIPCTPPAAVNPAKPVATP